MSRLSRFDNIEKERTAHGEGEEPAHERFEPEPAKAPETVIEPAQAPVERTLERFDPPDAGPSLDDDVLKRLAMLRCAACGTDNGKFEKRCFRCQAPLDSAETRALNEALLRESDEQRRLAAEADLAAREEQIRQEMEVKVMERARLERLSRDVAKEVHELYPDPLDARWYRAPAAFGLVVALLVLGVFLPFWGLRVLVWLLALGIGGVQVPPALREKWLAKLLPPRE